MDNRQTILVAMSGGVDSSVAAALLVEQGHTVIGVTMKTFCYSGTATASRTCCGLDGIADARRVADSLGIPHYVFDMEESFTRDVIDDFVREYTAGRTPNPCVRCNSNTKIPDLLRRGRAFGADAIATGHYARALLNPDGTVRILRATDPDKDQTYFLWGLPADLVRQLRFPVGELTKSEVRSYARRLGLATADKPESQEICFVPDGDYGEFLSSRVGADHPSLEPGPLVTADGRVIGEHKGYARYTVGQRRGLGGGFSLPLYVLDVRPATREVIVGTRDELASPSVTLVDLNWIALAPEPGDTVRIQLRHRAPAVDAKVDSVDADRVVMHFVEPQRAVTPGQSGAVYRGTELAGGGRIERSERPNETSSADLPSSRTP